MTTHSPDNPIKAEKRHKLHELRKVVNPFPYSFERNATALQMKEKYGHLKSGEHVEGFTAKLAGRVMTVRRMGKATFFNLQDQTGVIQAYLKANELPPESLKAFELLDIGDIVGVEGPMFVTKTGELTVGVKTFEILTKTLEPLPDKHHGLADIEIKYRARYLDLITNPHSRWVFETRSKIIREIRNFLDSRGFIEVETPVLQPLYGGAEAHPFETHHRTLDLKLYLKISPELYLKRLIVGGFEKVYDMTKNFRNEGIDRSHNPEFTMLEWYEAYTDYNYQMKQFEELWAHVAMKILGTTEVSYQGNKINLAPPWKRITMLDAIREYGGFDPASVDVKGLLKKAQDLGSELVVDSKHRMPSHGELICELFELTAEKKLIQPTFVLDHPQEISPLTKVHRKTKGLVERFEPFIATMEVGNAYSELNDPEEQRQRLEEQRKNQDEDAHPVDEDFLNAIEVGMPPTGGVGLGIDRMVMILTDQPSIRDVILFPTMRPKQ